MVAIPGLGAGAPPAVRRPVVDLAVGGIGVDDWRPSVVTVRVTAMLAPEVGTTTVVVGAAATGPAAAVGDDASLSLGFADDGTSAVVTGTVAAVTKSLDGARVLTIHDAAAALAATRADQGYAEQSTGDVINDLAARAGVAVDRADAGSDHPFLVVHGRRSAWAHVARLARRSGLLARVDGAGRLVVAPPDDADPLVVDPSTGALRLRSTSHGTVAAGVTALGEGAAGSQGADAWAWLASDRTGVEATAGDPSATSAVRVRDPGLRSPDEVRGAADAELAARARLARTGSLRVPGSPAVRPGGIVEVGADGDPLAAATGAVGLGGGAGPAGPGLGRWLVTAVRHRVAGAFTTDLELVAADEGGGGLPDLGF